MIAIVAYDIASNRRRAHVVKLLEAFGERVQYSVFECELTAERRLLLQERLAAAIHPTKDRIGIYPVCAACLGLATTIGRRQNREFSKL